MKDKPLAKLLNSTLPAMHSAARTLIYAKNIDYAPLHQSVILIKRLKI